MISTELPRCIIEWSAPDGVIRIDSTIDLVQHLSAGDPPGVETTRIAAGIAEVPRRSELAHAIVSGLDQGGLDHGGLDSHGDLRDGDVPAGGFVLVLSALLSADTTWTPSTSVEVTAKPPQFDELTDLDVTLAQVGFVTYPEDDTDRTFRRTGDIRCPRGHANANTNHTCRVCGESLDSTADRPGPRASTAAAGLRLPDGSVIPINRSIVIGRSPSAEAARLDGSPRLVPIDAPGTVSRTHVVLHLDGSSVTVTDCDARGRTAVVHGDDPAPIALAPWEPRTVSIGDTIKLGGPTTLTITDPAELRIPPALEPTAPPPERDETT